MEIDLRFYLQKASDALGWKPAWWPPYLRRISLPGAALFLLFAGTTLFAVGQRASASIETPPATTVEITGQITATAVALTLTPTATPTPRPTPASTATPVPVVYVVQSDTVVYLLKDPGLTVLASVPIGDEVEIRDGVGVTLMANITWVPVRYDGMDGWLADYQVYPIQAGYSLVGDGGMRLYDTPDGNPADWLYPGAAYRIAEMSGNWIRIAAADGREGWIATGDRP